MQTQRREDKYTQTQTGGFSNKCVMNGSLKIPLHLKRVATLRRETPNVNFTIATV